MLISDDEFNIASDDYSQTFCSCYFIYLFVSHFAPSLRYSFYLLWSQFDHKSFTSSFLSFIHLFQYISPPIYVFLQIKLTMASPSNSNLLFFLIWATLVFQGQLSTHTYSLFFIICFNLEFYLFIYIYLILNYQMLGWL